MLNFICAELWRYFHRPAGKALLILAAGLPVLLSLYIFIGLHWVQMGDIFTQTVGVGSFDALCRHFLPGWDRGRILCR